MHQKWANCDTCVAWFCQLFPECIVAPISGTNRHPFNDITIGVYSNLPRSGFRRTHERFLQIGDSNGTLGALLNLWTPKVLDAVCQALGLLG
jgi:hypothetical protein